MYACFMLSTNVAVCVYDVCLWSHLLLMLSLSNGAIQKIPRWWDLLLLLHKLKIHSVWNMRNVCVRVWLLSSKLMRSQYWQNFMINLQGKKSLWSIFSINLLFHAIISQNEATFEQSINSTRALWLVIAHLANQQKHRFSRSYTLL